MTPHPVSRRGHMRCYFHVRGPDVTHVDVIGVEVRDLESAIADAIQAIEEFRDEFGVSEDCGDWLLEIADERGTLLSTLSFV